MVQKLIDGIHVQNNLTINLDYTKVNDNKIGTWLGAVSYMATKISEDFGVATVNKNQGRGGNSERISAVEGLGQGNGGRGKDLGQGRGKG